MSAQWPLIVKQLANVWLPGLNGWGGVTVSQGRLVGTGQPNQYCTVGFVEGDETRAGSYRQTRDPDGTRYQETGNILSQIITRTAATDIPGQQDVLFAMCDAFEASVRADRTLGGVLSRDSNLDLLVEVLTNVTTGGTAESAVLTLNYYTVT